MNYSLTIDGVERKDRIVRSSFDFRTNRGGTPDELSFIIRTAKEEVIDPNLGLEVIFEVDGVKWFHGEVLQNTFLHKSAKVAEYRVTCVDHTRRSSKGEPVAEIYRNLTVNQILADIHFRYPQLSEFSLAGVNCDIVIDYCFFGHLKFPDVLRELSERTAYDFYIDADKVIHFYKPGEKEAPWSLTDTDGSWQRDTLSLSEKGDRIVNWILVEGDEYTSSELYTETFTGTGTDTEYKIANKYSGLTLKKNTVEQSVGAFGLDNPDEYDLLYDYNGGKLIWKDANKPSNGDILEIEGYRRIPVLAQVVEASSISLHGILPKKIKNAAIKTIESAKQYAQAEIARYSKEAFDGKFITRKLGLRAGQRILVSDSVAQITKSMTIQGTSTKMLGDGIFETSVSVASSETIDAIGVLARLLHSQNRSTTAEKTLNLFREGWEKIEARELSFFNKNQKKVSESLHLLESSQVLENASIEYVLCDHVQNGFADTKRRFLICHSPLACSE